VGFERSILRRSGGGFVTSAGATFADSKVPLEKRCDVPAFRPEHAIATDLDPVVEEGLISLGDPIKYLLPESAIATRGTLISDLLSHQSGLGSSYVAETETELVAALEALGDDLYAPRGDTSIGKATYGAFLVEHPTLGSTITARGFEDWGDNAILNHYLDKNIIVAVVTSRGPPEGEGEPYRNRISAEIEKILITRD